jgi:microcystin-dependent protein
MYVFLLLFILLFVCSYFYLKTPKTEGFTFSADMHEIIPVSISPDNSRISVPNTVVGNVGETITFGGDLIASKTSRVKGSHYVEANANITGDMTVGRTISTNDVLTNSHSALPPRGSIMAFVGKTDPDGWVICDGKPRDNDGRYQNLYLIGVGTIAGGKYTPPNLSERFLRGTNNANTMESNAASDVKVTLQNANLPSHTHTGNTGNITGSNTRDHDHSISKDSDLREPISDGRSTSKATDWSPNELNLIPENFLINRRTGNATIDIQHTHAFTTDATGSGEAFNIPPPLYYTVNYIVKY